MSGCKRKSGRQLISAHVERLEQKRGHGTAEEVRDQINDQVGKINQAHDGYAEADGRVERPPETGPMANAPTMTVKPMARP